MQGGERFFFAEGFLYGYNRVQYLQLVVIVIMITHTIFFRFYGLLVGPVICCSRNGNGIRIYINPLLVSMPEAFIRFYIGMVVMKLSNGSSLFFNVIFSDVVDICIRGYPHENLTFASALEKGADVKKHRFFRI